MHLLDLSADINMTEFWLNLFNYFNIIFILTTLVAPKVLQNTHASPYEQASLLYIISYMKMQVTRVRPKRLLKTKGKKFNSRV